VPVEQEELALSRAVQTEHVRQHSRSSRLRVIGSHSCLVWSRRAAKTGLKLALAKVQAGEARVHAELKTTELHSVTCQRR
jgi:hypothetical protein